MDKRLQADSAKVHSVVDQELAIVASMLEKSSKEELEAMQETLSMMLDPAWEKCEMHDSEHECRLGLISGLSPHNLFTVCIVAMLGFRTAANELLARKAFEDEFGDGGEGSNSDDSNN